MRYRPQVVENSRAAMALAIGTELELRNWHHGKWWVDTGLWNDSCAATPATTVIHHMLTCAYATGKWGRCVCRNCSCSCEFTCKFASLGAFWPCCGGSYTLQLRGKKPCSGVTAADTLPFSLSLCCVADVQKDLLVAFSHRWWLKSVEIDDTDTCLTVVLAFFFFFLKQLSFMGCN